MCHNDELSWLFTNRLCATRYMKVKRMGITEILRRIWLFSANKIKSSESFSKQSTQLIGELNSSLRQIIDSQQLNFGSFSDFNGSIMNQIMIMYFNFISFCSCCVASQKITKLVAFLFDKHNVSIKEIQIVYRLFLVNCYLMHVPRLPSQPASNVGG